MDHAAPRRDSKSFRCPFCGHDAHHHWQPFVVGYESKGRGGEGAWRGIGRDAEGFAMSICEDCYQPMVWRGEEAIWPPRSSAPPASEYMPARMRVDFEEARQVFDRSPRAAAALLRIAIVRLCEHLGRPGRSLDDDIAALVKRGLPVAVQEALQVVRVVGADAVGPGELDPGDDREMARALFDLVNVVVEKMIGEPALWRTS
jgi:hypothetical protein